jgi:hypothetical protein
MTRKPPGERAYSASPARTGVFCVADRYGQRSRVSPVRSSRPRKACESHCGLGSVAGAAADAEHEQPPAPIPYAGQSPRDRVVLIPVDRLRQCGDGLEVPLGVRGRQRAGLYPPYATRRVINRAPDNASVVLRSRCDHLETVESVVGCADGLGGLRVFALSRHFDLTGRSGPLD